ncbi:hypothetical protein AGMMS49992_29340 [Clostridia bacterium]|nr:hypothetical protein AGMMS49992_29340 [Clostridia bacterium]
MPKVLLTHAQRDAEAAKIWAARFKACVAYHKAFRGMNVEQIAHKMCLPRSTMYQKLQNPHELALGEALQLMNLLGFTNAERSDLFGYSLETLKAAANE